MLYEVHFLLVISVVYDEDVLAAGVLRSEILQRAHLHHVDCRPEPTAQQRLAHLGPDLVYLTAGQVAHPLSWEPNNKL